MRMVASYTGGTFTINPSGPGTLAGTSVTVSGCTVTSNVAYAISTKVEDAMGSFNDIVIVPGAGSFTATCVRGQLPATLTGNYVLVNTA
jgi:hypothetical protein